MKRTLEAIKERCEEVGKCLIWQRGVNSAGHPSARMEGKITAVRTAIYDLYGKTVRKDHVLITRCGDRRCLSESCIAQVTIGRMVKLSYERGHRNTASEYKARQSAIVRQGRTKLTQSQADAIKASDKKAREIAAEFGISESWVHKMRGGLGWKQSAPGSSVFDWRGTIGV